MQKQTYEVVIPDYKYWRQNIKCMTGCPVSTDSRGYVRAIAAGDFERAYWISRIPNPLASICGRICAAPCELACRRRGIDEAVSIRALKRFVTEKYGSSSANFTDNFTKKLVSKGSESGYEVGIIGIAGEKKSARISIIGSGPAGLSAAHDLALMGFKPVIYEMENVAGGMCSTGIPPYRLPRNILKAEIEVIKSLGVEIKFGVEIGKDIKFDKLFKDSEALLIAVGAKKSRMLSMEGSDAEGVFGGVDFLRDVFTLNEVSIGKNVVVIGGGNVAYDVARTAIRQKGVESVSLVCIEQVEQMLADVIEIEEGHEEGIKRINGYGPVKIEKTAQGNVKSITFKKCLAVFDNEGRFNPRYDEDDLLTLQADTVYFAIGQTFNIDFVKNSGLEVEMTERGTLKLAKNNVSTSLPGLFVAGDLAYGPKLVIDAVASGKRAAAAIYQHIVGKYINLHTSESHSESYGDDCDDNHVPHIVDYEKIHRLPVPGYPIKERLKEVSAPVESGFTHEMAVEQGSRCLNCAVNTIFDSDRCIMCGGCIDVCPEYCLKLVSMENIRGSESMTALFRNRYGREPEGDGAAIIKDEERCIRCSLCANRCPVDAITMERFIFKEVLKA
ncbi:MAG: FAD-dependent oxidoreductase [Nitrospirae bacterium]|nr:FAD-dependent oxidoreductase [Nitrospirota bacterium]MBF0542342.1 FAD-dependent oxidoreductase [Nitrospirota bacterium]